MAEVSGWVGGLVRALALVIAGLGLVSLPFPTVEYGPEGLSVSAEVSEAHAKPPRRRRRRRAPNKAPPARPPAETPAPPPLPTRGPTRIDFDDRLVQGQTNQSGAVVLFARKASGLRSMVDRRKSFRDRTIRTIFDRRSAP